MTSKKAANPFDSASGGTARRRRAGEVAGGVVPSGTDSDRTRGVGRARKAYDIDNEHYRSLTLLQAHLKSDKVTASDLVNEALADLFAKPKYSQLLKGV